MENNCMANPCEGYTEETCVEMMKKLQADEKVKQLLEAGKDSNGEEVFGEMLDDMLLTSILSNVDEISHKWEVYKDKAN